MDRKPGTDERGQPFDAKTVQLVWEKAAVVPGASARAVRRDVCGTLMFRSQYGHCRMKFGWEIDHIVPVTHGGSDELPNLQPLQWANNRRKADSLYWQCA